MFAVLVAEVAVANLSPHRLADKRIIMKVVEAVEALLSIHMVNPLTLILIMFFL